MLESRSLLHSNQKRGGAPVGPEKLYMLCDSVTFDSGFWKGVPTRECGTLDSIERANEKGFNVEFAFVGNISFHVGGISSES